MYARLLAGGGRGGRPLSKRTVQLTHVTLSKALNDALDWDLVLRNVATKANSPTPTKPEMKAWTAAELDRFLRFIEDRDPWLYPLWLLIALSGARRGEIAGAR